MSKAEMTDDDKARILFKLLSMSARRIKAGKPMKQHEIRLLRRMFPDTYHLCRELSFEEMIAIDSKYIDHETYGENVKVLLSPEGREWLKDSLSKIKAFEERGE